MTITKALSEDRAFNPPEADKYQVQLSHRKSNIQVQIAKLRRPFGRLVKRILGEKVVDFDRFLVLISVDRLFLP
jgi:hypothetical protein